MKPISTEIINFGPHRDTDVNWEEAGEVIVINAPNGTGKTFLLEADFACLYGFWPSRGKIYDGLTLGATEGSITTVFEFKGVRYEARREIKVNGKTAKQEAWLSCDGAIVAGPKVGDFQARVNALLGPAEVALATWFSSQGSKGDLCNATPGGRRKIFGELLGFDVLDRIAVKCGASAGHTEAHAEILENQVMDQPDFDEAIKCKAGEASEAEERLSSHEHQRAEAEGRRENARAALSRIEAGTEPLKAKIQAAVEALDSHGRLAAEYERAEAEERELAEKSGRRLDLEKDVERLSESKSEREALQAQESKFHARREWEEAKHRFTGNVDAAEREMEALESHPGVSEEERALAEALPRIEAEYRLAEESKKSAEEADRAAQNRLSTLKAERKAAESEIARLEAKISKRPETPAEPEVCATCPLMREWADLPAQLEAKREVVATVEKQLADLEDEDLPEIPDLTALIEKGAQARAAQQAVADNAGAAQKLREAQSRHGEAVRVLNVHTEVEPAVVADPTESLTEICAKIERLASAPDLLKVAEEASGKLTKFMERLEALEKNLDTARSRMTTTEAEAVGARKALIDREAEGQVQRTAMCEAGDDLDRIDGLIVSIRDAIARAQAEVESLKRRRDETEEKRAKAKAMREKAARLRMLQLAYGPRGIQALLIDQAAPDLEDLAAGLLEQLTDGRMQLRITTQRVGRDNATHEDFSILAQDREGERDVALFSGGEQRILRTVLRLAIALWQAKLHGRQPESIRVDEGFDALDGANALRMVELMKSLGEKFGRVLIVTHNEEIAARMPARIGLKKGFAGVTVMNGVGA